MAGKLFSYKALDARGKTLTGVMEATSSEEVGNWLSDRQYFVLEISSAPLATLAALPKGSVTISTHDMNFFLLQLSSLINAGCPLIMSLQALYRQVNSGPLKDLLKDLKEKIEMGKSFSDALKNHPHNFSNLFITMVEVGEVAGILDQVLERYSQIHDAMLRIRGKVIKSMIYPAILLVVTIIVSWALLVKVFPVFIEQIESHGQILPLPTRVVLFFSKILSENSILLFASLTLLIVFFIQIRKTSSGGRFFSSLGLTVPLIGNLVRQMELALFARTLGTLLKCGVPILISLGAVEKALNNAVYKEILGEIKTGVSRGESLSAGMMKHRDLFPESLILMVDVGERGGNTGEMLEKAGTYFERDLENVIETAVTFIQPILVVFLAVFIATLAFAMYLPLFDIIKVVR